MDRQTAHITYLEHRPQGWLAAIGIDRCGAGCGSWPCNSWITARDRRSYGADQAAIATMTDRVGRRPADERLPRYLAGQNRGPR